MKASMQLINGPALTQCNFKVKKFPLDSNTLGQIKVNYKVEVTLNYQDQDQVVTMEMIVKIQDPKLPITLQVAATTILKLKGNPTEKIGIKLSFINGGPILYTFLRETIADITRKANFPPFYINPMNFEKMNKQMIPPSLKSKSTG
jgi:preprotein translocase subunit SecB